MKTSLLFGCWSSFVSFFFSQLFWYKDTNTSIWWIPQSFRVDPYVVSFLFSQLLLLSLHIFSYYLLLFSLNFSFVSLCFITILFRFVSFASVNIDCFLFVLSWTSIYYLLSSFILQAGNLRFWVLFAKQTVIFSFFRKFSILF